MPVFFLTEGMICLMKTRQSCAFRARAHFGREPYLSREGERPRPVAFARAGKSVSRGRTAARFNGALLVERVNEITAPGGRRPISGNGTKKPAAGLPARAMQFLRPWIHAGDLPDMSNPGNRCRPRRRVLFKNSQKIVWREISSLRRNI